MFTADRPRIIAPQDQILFVANEVNRVIEAREDSLENRIGVLCFVYDSQNQLVDAQTGIPLLETTAKGAGILAKEASATQRITELVGDENAFPLWISPPDEQRSEETRLMAFITLSKSLLAQLLPAIKKTFQAGTHEQALTAIKQSSKVVLLFAFPTKHTKDQCLEIGQRLALQSPSNNPYVHTIDQLRSSPLLVNGRCEYWIDALTEYIDLPEASIQTVKNGGVFKNKAQAQEKIGPVAQESFAELELARNNPLLRRDLWKKLRRKEEQAGYKTKKGNEACPWDEFDAIYKLTQKLPSKQLTEKKRVLRCGNCKAWLNLEMSAGDKCPHCQKTYEGC